MQTDWPIVASPPAPLPCTAVIAAKNEEQTIALVLEAVRPYVQEMIVVDGCSTDGTARVAAAHGARVVTDSGKGKGDALRHGVEAAQQDVIVFLDADGSHSPHDIPSIVEPILAQGADMVIGSRMRGGSDELSGDFDALVRFVSTQVITLGINWRFGTRLSDSQNGFRAIRREVFRELKLRENHHTIEQEMLMRALRLGYKVAEVPSHEYRRLCGESHISLWRMWPHYLASWVKGMIGLR